MIQRFNAAARFKIPEPPAALVRRHRLVDRLTAATAPMTLVVGSPGAGKTAVLAEWVAVDEVPTAWLSCDATDIDPVRFWSALILAIQQVVPGAGTDALKRLEEHDGETEDMAASLANDCAFASRLLIVIDDFHEAGPAPVVFAAFVRSLPGGVRLVLSTRHDPSFPVGRLRSQGRLLELRDEDLRFTSAEATVLYAELDIAVDAADVVKLCDLTEGWVAGLVLAGISLAARGDVGTLLEAFATTDRGLVDLLVNEVIDVQPDDITDFLMVTSVLDAFDAELCDAVTGRIDSSEILRRLHHSHLFVIALDQALGRYRYHHLFAAFLQARLRLVSRDRYRAAHLAAADAFVERGELMSAVRHAMAGDDVEAALQHVRTLAATAIDVEGRQTALDTVRAWLRLHGERYLHVEPNVVLECCLVLNSFGALDECEAWLRRVARLADTLSTADASFLQVMWGFLALHRGDPQTALDLVGRGVAMVGDEITTHFWLCQHPVVTSTTQVLLGDAGALRRAVADGRRRLTVSPFVDSIRFPGFVAWAANLDGELVEAKQQAELVLERARSMPVPERDLAMVLPILTLAAVAREQDELERAESLVQQGVDVAAAAGRPPYLFVSSVERARLLLAQNRREDALSELDAARSIMPDATRVVTDQLDRIAARAAVFNGEHRARTLVDALLPGVEQTLLQARLALADHDHDAARRLVEATISPTASRRRRVEQELLAARSLAPHDRDASMTHVVDALRLAEPVGLLRAVVESGDDILALVDVLPADPRTDRFVGRILDTAHRRAAPAGDRRAQPLVDPLSEREQDVLRYLASRLTYGEISGHLYISVNTMKSHVKAVYRKLGVSSRSEAVAEARRNGLL